MNGFESKLSLYDILSMLIPGGTILLTVIFLLQYEFGINQLNIDSVLGTTIALVLSYLIGLITHSFSAILWKPFRNNLKMIGRALLNAQKEIYKCRYIDKPQLTDEIFNCSSEIVCNILLIVGTISLIVEFLINYCSEKNDCFLWCTGWLSIPLCFLVIIECLRIRLSYKIKKGYELRLLMTKYYEAYYYVAKNKYGNDISIIEGQVAFIQSMFLPLMLIVILPIKKVCEHLGFDSCILKTFIVLIMVLMIPTLVMRQHKIYQRVWEDYEFLKRLDKE